MLLSKKIEIRIKQPNLNYYLNKGYSVSYNDLLIIEVNELPPFSREIVDVSCDICGKNKKIKYFVYYKNVKKHGIYTCSQKCCQSKTKMTNLERYGCNRPIQNKKIHDKLKNTCLNKYGYESATKNIHTINKIKNGQIESLLEKYKKFNINYVNEHVANINCDLGRDHSFDINFALLGNRIKMGTTLCLICNPINPRYSGRELQLQEFIKNEYNENISINDKKQIGLELDIYIPKLKLAFEFNGLYWHSELYKNKNYHRDKTEICNKKDIKLIHIYEDDWIYKNDIVKSRIRNLLGKSDKIYARKCDIKEIFNNDLVKKFLFDNHIQGFVGSKVKIGLFYQEELVSLMTFGNKRKAMGQKAIDGDYEMLRFCNKLNTIVIGGASRLFKYFIEKYKPNEVISYADRSWSQGKLYENLDFQLVGKTEPNYYYIIDGLRKHRFNFRKDVLIKNSIEDKNKTEHEIMLERKIYRIYDSGNLKYKYTYV